MIFQMYTTRFGDSVTPEIRVTIRFILYETNIATAFVFVYINNARKLYRQYAETWVFVTLLRKWTSWKIYPAFIFDTYSVVLCAKFQNDLANEIDFMSERGFAFFSV